MGHQGWGVDGHILHTPIEEVDNFVPSVSSEGGLATSSRCRMGVTTAVVIARYPRRGGGVAMGVLPAGGDGGGCRT